MAAAARQRHESATSRPSSRSAFGYAEPMQSFNLFADYFQFYLQDEAVDGDFSDAWTHEAVTRLLAVAPGAVGVGTVRNMEVPVSLEVLASEPPLNAAPYDHIVEGPLSVAGKRLVIAGCTDYFPEAARIQIAPGSYRVRVCYSGLDSLSEDGLDGDDRYHLQLWPAPLSDVAVVKQRAQ